MIITVFRSRLRRENAGPFLKLAAQMQTLAEAMPGFISYTVYAAEDGERCSIIEFETAEEQLAWRNLAEHAAAQELGRESFYDEYSLVVAEPFRTSTFQRQQ